MLSSKSRLFNTPLSRQKWKNQMTKTQEDIVHEDIEVEEEEDSENLNPNLGQRKGKKKETLYIAQKQ